MPNSMWKTPWSGRRFFGLIRPTFNFSAIRQNNTARNRKHTIPIMKHGGGSILVWGCFPVAVPGRLVKIERCMNAAKYKTILEGNHFQSAGELDNDPKHTAKTRQELFFHNTFLCEKDGKTSKEVNTFASHWYIALDRDSFKMFG